jgi:hypothetical protein
MHHTDRDGWDRDGWDRDGRANPGLRRGGASVIVEPHRNNMKGGDPVSHCLKVAPFAVTWISDARVAV